MKQSTIDLIIFAALKKMDANKFYSDNDHILVNTIKQHVRNSYKKFTGRKIKDSELKYILRRINKALHKNVNEAIVINPKNAKLTDMQPVES